MKCLTNIMEVILGGTKRETILDPMYKRIDKNGRVYIDKNLVGQEILIVPIRPIPQDKIDFIRVGRGARAGAD